MYCELFIPSMEARVTTLPKENEYPELVYVLVQLVTFCFSFFLRLLVVRGECRSDFIFPKPSGKKYRYVLYANHQSKLDPFILCGSFPFTVFIRLSPFRFFVANKYFSNPLAAMLLTLNGCFPAYLTSSTLYGLEKAKMCLKRGQTIFIFPSGKRTREKIARNGIAVLAGEQNVYFVPLYINWVNRLSCQVRIGSAFRPDALSTPQSFMEKVYALAM